MASNEIAGRLQQVCSGPKPSVYSTYASNSPFISGGGRVMRRCWINFQFRGVLLVWITVAQGPIVPAVGAGEGCMDIFSLVCRFSFLSPSLWETARYRLKYCLRGPLSPNQPTNQPFINAYIILGAPISLRWTEA